MDLEDTHIRSINIGKYRNNYEGFYKKSTYQMTIHRGRIITIQGYHISLTGILLSFFSLGEGL